MGSVTDKIKGAVNQGIGAIKQGVGEAVGNPNLQVKGAVQKLKGKAQEMPSSRASTRPDLDFVLSVEKRPVWSLFHVSFH